VALFPGTRIGAYEVVAKLGEGGMGEVYRARDSKLKRDVALKVLPDNVAGDRERLARFQREAEVLASLNHPHIAQIFGLEANALVMELVDGEDLSQRIAKGPIPIDDALPIAKQIAEALEAAHERGIIHRDLKPANIKVRADGMVKVLDFGLAKALDEHDASAPHQLANSPTITSPAMTMGGVILGTAAYMSPEQARGKPVDRRTDIWAFGAVVFEMLAGRRPFDGETLTDLLGAIVKSEPDWTSLPAETPASIRRLLRRTLEKNLARRLDSIGAARLDIDDAMAGEHEASAAPVSAKRAGIPAAVAAAAAVVLAMMGAASAWLLKPSPAPAPSSAIRFSHAIPDSHVMGRMGRRSLTISPDGKLIAYIAEQQIFLRRLDELEARPIPGSNVDPIDLAFSPDSQSIAFNVPRTATGATAGGSIRRLPIAGGSTATLCSSDSVWGIRWQDGRVLFSDGKQIVSVPDTGGAQEILVSAEGDESLGHPQLLSDGRTLLYTVKPRGAVPMVVVQPPGGPRRPLAENAFDGFVSPTGHLVWVRDNVLFAQAIETGSWRLTGKPVQVMSGVNTTTFTWAAHAGVSNTGTLAFLAARAAVVSEMIWVDRNGTKTAVGAPARIYRATRISPDGSRIAATTDDGELLVWDVGRRALSRLESSLATDAVIWSYDGRSLIYVWQPPGADSPALYRRAADGTGTPERLFGSESFDPLVALQDGRVLGRSSTAGTTGLMRLWQPLSKTLSPPLLPGGEPPMMTADVSPDGRWVAYHTSSALGHVGVRPFPDVQGGHWPITMAAANRPMWSRSGRELFWVDGAPPVLWRADVMSRGNEPFAYSTPVAVMPLAEFDTNATGQRSFDVAPDGQRFLLRQQPPVEGATRFSITVVTNWFEELRQKVPRQ
jgi:tRNA A-37 threonylcarbamoyl transferase component Bud32/WD40 repeat protein